MSDDVARLLIAESKRRLLGESLPRLEKCLALLSEEEIWRRPNHETVSVGNLVLHLCGNLGQWLLSTFGGQPDRRERAAEFEEKGPIAKAELLARLRDTMRRTELVLDAVDSATLGQLRRVQGFQETGVAILVHVVEHFSYHVGQATFIVKARSGRETGWYAGQELGRTGRTGHTGRSG